MNAARRRILVQFAHPVLERSQVNRPLLETVRRVDGVTVNDLFVEYPTLSIDVEREQRLLLEHDVIVFHHPFYWYSTPAILKQWQDMVLEHGWAYGPGGTQLTGKITFNLVTTGGPASAYAREGYNRFTVRELLAPWEQTANLCHMRFLAPYVAHGSLRPVAEIGIDGHRANYRDLVEALRDGRLDLERAAAAQQLVELIPIEGDISTEVSA
ncbi:MAG: NAD(P)H-dependent oxidoreductase [Deltaproteobacteria bacterium]|nr:NAD(P)H-dependent oxidoreductase [Nannocystaceae bacterium]